MCRKSVRFASVDWEGVSDDGLSEETRLDADGKGAIAKVDGKSYGSWDAGRRVGIESQPLERSTVRLSLG